MDAVAVGTVGQSIPSDTPHAVSVSLPTWKANVGYEEGEEWVVNRMTTGYPRFFIHKSIEAFAAAIVRQHGSPSEQAYLFPSPACTARCAAFFRARLSNNRSALPRVIDLYPNDARKPIVSAILFLREYGQIAKMFWQHTGEGISSRRAEYCFKAFDRGVLSAKIPTKEVHSSPKRSVSLSKGPKRYQKRVSADQTVSVEQCQALKGDTPEPRDHAQFVEERFGRNLDTSLADSAKLAVRRRIAGALTANVDLPEASKLSHPPTRIADVEGFSEDDVYLYSCGMNSIFHAHDLMMACRGRRKSISYGFPYTDTLKILEKFGPGCLFYGHGSDSEIDDLERRCKDGERWLALFCEFPGNPLLRTPDLPRIRSLADRYDFAIIVDETIGNFINVHVLPYADIVVSSLTKVFTGECNVMGGSLILNPQQRYYSRLKSYLESNYEDNYWPEDAVYMERNSRDFVSRIQRINYNAEAICDALLPSKLVKEVYYPKNSPSKTNYDRCRNPDGGYGGLLSVTFRDRDHAIAFYDRLETAKGPSLGTNFTLCSPYVLLAHYQELEWAAQFGVDEHLVRMSVGLEDTTDLVSMIQQALKAAEQSL